MLRKGSRFGDRRMGRSGRVDLFNSQASFD
jgi:hypothetical protein